ncbi:MAG: methionine gamma-lyase family protein, partial [Lachnospiraceae bacterium]|nr:methionine gamma-lyase family protein [Lachnospiraceae bacterium]
MNVNDLRSIYKDLGISENVLKAAEEVLDTLKDRFTAIDENAELCQLKVLRAFQKNNVNESCLIGTTGYGYNDIGRDTLEKVYADYFGTEDCLVRPQITCGTHALALALMSNLRPGDELLSAVGKPYDTLEEVIGIRDSVGSLAEYGITYAQAELSEDGTPNLDNIRNAINERTRLVTIQRSKGYQTRPSLSVAQIGEIIKTVKSVREDIICMVDNCYGE